MVLEVVACVGLIGIVFVLGVIAYLSVGYCDV